MWVLVGIGVDLVYGVCGSVAEGSVAEGGAMVGLGRVSLAEGLGCLHL